MQRTRTGDFNWVDISSKDLEVQSDFYVDLFGWTTRDVPFAGGQIYRMFYKDDHVVTGMSDLTDEMLAAGAPTAWNVYLAADNIDEMVDLATGLEATVAMPPMDVPDNGRMAAVLDPTGGAIFFWKPTTPDETVVYGVPGTFSWAELSTRDPEKAADFYKTLVGWDIQVVNQGPVPYWQINIAGDGEGGILQMPESVPEEVPPFWMPYFGSADLETDVAKTEELGGYVITPPTEIGSVAFAVLSDPEGAVFGLMQVHASSSAQ